MNIWDDIEKIKEVDMIMERTRPSKMRKRRRKNGWYRATGKVVSVRLSDGVYAALEKEAQKRGLTRGTYGKMILERELGRGNFLHRFWGFVTSLLPKGGHAQR